jgi:hypothetical protein
MPKGLFHQFFPATQVKKGGLGVAPDIIVPGTHVRILVKPDLQFLSL